MGVFSRLKNDDRFGSQYAISSSSPLNPPSHWILIFNSRQYCPQIVDCTAIVLGFLKSTIHTTTTWDYSWPVANMPVGWMLNTCSGQTAEAILEWKATREVIWQQLDFYWASGTSVLYQIVLFQTFLAKTTVVSPKVRQQLDNFINWLSSP
jgi:hypothetical protein